MTGFPPTLRLYAAEYGETSPKREGWQPGNYVANHRVWTPGRVTAKPPTVVDLVWIGELKFSTGSRPGLIIDSAGTAGPSPVETLGLALAGCMAMDVAHVLAKGRRSPRALRSRLVGDRAQEDPHRFLRIALHFTIEGDVPADLVERAIRLSREKYCSVWHSMRQDIDFRVTFDLVP